MPNLLPPVPVGQPLQKSGIWTSAWYQWLNLVQVFINQILNSSSQIVVTLSASQMAAAYATPATLISPPGSNSVVYITSAFVYTNSTGHTALATGTAPIIQYGTTNHGGGTLATSSGLVAGDITAATSQIRNLGPMASAAKTGLSNQGIYFSNATGAYTAGTGTTVTFIINYTILTASI